ncbi:DUF1499 domain-containing protein [Mesorhizobium sp. BR1-1-16]|uniref:DUF1499 domain-containing protein n=1 Tax=Mesorhizobium sp. BR1-1-16 TaxID=2876653 RepID=UPI001CCC5F87|nr:DUF1499 domain-containing protein [Mesorhizobium sp. BR1-1-16]MBZ9934866.1 DUF1499 domain-containing protein [Mesorhizobium sp. BR1-1-16]
MRRPQRPIPLAAIWALRLAALPIPLLILAGLLHRASMIALAPLFIVIGLAWLMAGLALMAAVVAFRSIWVNGGGGAAPAVGATALALLVLAVPAAIIVDLVRLPRIADLSTDLSDPPLFTAAPDSVVMRPLPNEVERAAQLDAYPDILPRHYPQSPERVYLAIAGLVAAHGWTVTDARAPDSDNEVGWIEATARTLLLALPADVVIRIIADGSGALVDMRSASRIGAHDLGDDARRIRDFFADLDAALQGVPEGEDDARPQALEGDGVLPPLPEPAPVSRS